MKTSLLPGRIRARWNALPAPATLVLALSLALLPLGILSLLAAVDNYRFVRDRQSQDAHAQLASAAGAMRAIIERDIIALRAANSALLVGSGRRACVQQLSRLIVSTQSISGLAVLDRQGRTICSSGLIAIDNDVVAALPASRTASDQPLLRIDRGGRALQLITGPEQDRFAVGTIQGTTLQAAIYRGEQSDRYDLSIHAGDRVLPLDAPMPSQTGAVSLSRPLPGSGGALHLLAPPTSMRAGEILAAMLPLLMWAAALVIATLVVHTLLSGPLGRMRREVERYAAGNHSVRLGSMNPGSTEVAALARAFDNMADSAERHEGEMQAGLERQRHLVREVHHRVKNNLQVIASLLSIQARRAETPEATLAYAAIQRRVDALALVHRHHYAEEEGAGIRLDSLLKELLPSLKGRDDQLALSLSTDEGRVNQDVAIAVAFILAEMLSDVASRPSRLPSISIVLRRDHPGTARLCIQSEAFRGDDEFGPRANSDVARIIQGMARKMQAPLNHDSQTGRYELTVPLIDR